tara:strand:+ start:75 stop:485 length:411 start_codon:yes stop_codon:yes gene_type:complete
MNQFNSEVELEKSAKFEDARESYRRIARNYRRLIQSIDWHFQQESTFEISSENLQLFMDDYSRIQELTAEDSKNRDISYHTIELLRKGLYNLGKNLETDDHELDLGKYRTINLDFSHPWSRLALIAVSNIVYFKTG